MYADNVRAMKRNEAGFNDLTGERHTIGANGNILGNFKYP